MSIVRKKGEEKVAATRCCCCCTWKWLNPPGEIKAQARKGKDIVDGCSFIIMLFPKRLAINKPAVMGNKDNPLPTPHEQGSQVLDCVTTCGK